MAAIRASESSANAKTPFREVEPYASLSADAVKIHPFDMVDIHAALQEKILEQPPTGLSTIAETNAARIRKQRRKPRATLYSPPLPIR